MIELKSDESDKGPDEGPDKEPEIQAQANTFLIINNNVNIEESNGTDSGEKIEFYNQNHQIFEELEEAQLQDETIKVNIDCQDQVDLTDNYIDKDYQINEGNKDETESQGNCFKAQNDFKDDDCQTDIEQIIEHKPNQTGGDVDQTYQPNISADKTMNQDNNRNENSYGKSLEIIGFPKEGSLESN